MKTLYDIINEKINSNESDMWFRMRERAAELGYIGAFVPDDVQVKSALNSGRQMLEDAKVELERSPSIAGNVHGNGVSVTIEMPSGQPICKLSGYLNGSDTVARLCRLMEGVVSVMLNCNPNEYDDLCDTFLYAADAVHEIESTGKFFERLCETDRITMTVAPIVVFALENDIPMRRRPSVTVSHYDHSMAF